MPRFICRLLVVLLMMPSLALAGRDWTTAPAVVQMEMPKELYALGDMHGDYDRACDLLAAAGLMAKSPASPQAVQWTGKKAVLVCTGDMIDKYTQSIEVIQLMRTLQQQAAADGGRVIVTLGNHEAGFLAGKGDAKKSKEFVDELQEKHIPVMDVVDGKDSAGIGAWLNDLPIAAKVGDWFFCHAGNTGGKTIAQLTADTQQQFAQHGFDSPILSDANSLLEARMHPRPWWEWDGSEPAIHDANTPNAGTDPKARLKTLVNALGCEHLVFGHQPGKIEFSDGTRRKEGEMCQKFDGLVFLIDTGMSRGVNGGRGALLRIKQGSTHHEVTAVYADGTGVTMIP